MALGGEGDWWVAGFSALQRAEIAEIANVLRVICSMIGFSALQRAEIAEIDCE